MSDVHTGSEIGGYRLELLVGSGSFGSVWRARHVTSNRVVALKVLTGTYSTGDAAASRAAIELLAASASAASPHVVKVLDGGVEPVPFVVMEYIEGRNLRAEIDAQGPLGVEETLRIGHAVAEALRVLNDARIIHRDVKPANVMITAQGVPKLTDFGIAKIVGYESVTLTGVPMSPAYTAPEAWEENRASHYSDIYALGIMMYECLTGRPPFVGTYPQVYQAHLSREPDYDALPEKLPSLLELLRKCLAKDPADRPADAAVCLVLIEQAQAEWRERYGANVPPVAPEPRAFGPWLRQSPHPSLPGAWLCIHEQTAQAATVEVVSTDDVALGQALRRAVEANASLVPLGAEKLLGTNRLILRPGEAWATPPTGQFQFWVSREEPVVDLNSRPLSLEELSRVSTKVLELEGAAEAAGLSLEPWRLVLDESMELSWSRPGLPPVGEASLTVPDWLRELPLSNEAMEAAAQAETVAGLIDSLRANSASAADTAVIWLPAMEPELAPGVAQLEEPHQTVEDGLATVQPLRIGDFGQPEVPPPPPADQEPEGARADEEGSAAWPEGTESRRGSGGRRRAVAVGAVSFLALVAATAAILLMRDDGDEFQGGAAAVLTEAATPSPTTVGSPTATTTPVAPPEPFPPRTQPRQEDQCGEFTIVREAVIGTGIAKGQFDFPSDHITVQSRDGSTLLDLPSRGTVGGEASQSFLVKSCYDMDADGTMELLTQFYVGGTNVPDSTLYRLTSPSQKIADLEGIVLEARELDGQPPTELVGTDMRWKYFATSGAQSTYPLILLQLTDGKLRIVTGSFPDLVRADRDRNMGRLPACLELVRDSYNTGFDACHAGALTSIMVDSLNLGDWETFRQQSKIDSTVAARFDDCREYMLAKASTLAAPTSLCNLGGAPTPPTAPAPSATQTPVATPKPIAYVAVFAGAYHACGLKSDASVICWGSNGTGQSAPPSERFLSVGAGYNHTCGVKTDGTVACWGLNDEGQATPPSGKFASVSSRGGLYTCAVNTEGTVVCWGYNTDGQATPPSGKFVSVNAGNGHTCGVRTDRTVACWGGNGSGQAIPPGGQFASVSVGFDHTCGVRTDGTIACWGSNSSGQATPPAGQFASVDAGGNHACGVKFDGRVACWGNNQSGQATPPGGEFASVSARAAYTCGVKTDGSVTCWGENNFGQSTPPK